MSQAEVVSGALDRNGVDGILITNIKNIRYLSGFRGSAGFLIISRGGRIFCTDFRYGEQAQSEVSGFTICVENEDSHKTVIRKARELGIRTLGFESSATYELYRKLLRKGVRLKALNLIVEDLRKIKDNEEVRSIRKAVGRAEGAFREIRPYIRKGVTERKIAFILEEALKKRGCSGVPFDIIVASGKNSALPHAKPTDRKISGGDLVVVDWGGEADGYYSDMTRTMLVRGENISKKIEIYEKVLTANTEAIHAAREGIHAKAIDKAARDVITKAGFSEFFGHGTGHGVGLDVHELPRISRRGIEVIRAGMVFTIEPGIYLPDEGGVRIEDMVCADSNGCEVLTSLPKRLEIIQ